MTDHDSSAGDPMEPIAPASAPAPEAAAVTVAPRPITAEDLRQPRPLPSLFSLGGAAAGAFLVAGMFILLGELDGDDRLAGIGLSLVFEVAGVALLVFAGSRRSAAAGGTLAGIALVPLLAFLFTDPSDSYGGGGAGDPKGAITGVLVVAALVWFCAWFFGPGRRYAFFLAGACVAIWLAVQVQLVPDPVERLLFTPYSLISPYGLSSYDSYSSLDYDEEYYDQLDACEAEDYEEYQACIDEIEDSRPQPDDPSTKLGVTSLVFGAAYLILGRRRDQLGDGRAGTAFFAVAAPILYYGVGFLSDGLGQTGTSALALVIGAAGLWCGTRGGRRFTSWAGTIVATIATISLVEVALGDSSRAMAAVLVLLGLIVAVGLAEAERRRGPEPSGVDGGPDQGEDDGGGDVVVAATTGVPASVASPVPGSTTDGWGPPAGDPVPPPTSGWGPPTAEPWSPPSTDAPSTDPPSTDPPLGAF